MARHDTLARGDGPSITASYDESEVIIFLATKKYQGETEWRKDDGKKLYIQLILSLLQAVYRGPITVGLLQMTLLKTSQTRYRYLILMMLLCFEPKMRSWNSLSSR